jgi:hypothetical protein
VQPPPQCGADVEAVTDAVLARKARAHCIVLVIEQLASERSAAFRMLDPSSDSVGLQQSLHLFEGLAIKDRLMFSLEPFSAVMHLAEIDPVLQEVGEGTVGEGNATLVFCDLGVTPLGDDFPAIEFGYQLAEGFQLEIEAEDGADGFCLSLVDDELFVFCVVAQGDGTSGPLPFLSGGGDLVPDALGSQLAFELRKGQEHIQGKPAHGSRGVELLSYRDERDRLGVERFDQLCEVGERSGKTVDLIDYYHVDPAGLDFAEQPFQSWALKVAPGIGGVVIRLREDFPALRGLALDIGFASLALSVERIELLI